MRLLPASAVALLSLGLLGPSAGAGEDAGAPPDRVFFRDPDKETGARIAELISRVATGYVADRTKPRRELESIGHWSVDPLLEAVQGAEAPIRCATLRVHDPIGDRRAVEPLRAVMMREQAHQYVAGF